MFGRRLGSPALTELCDDVLFSYVLGLKCFLATQDVDLIVALVLIVVVMMMVLFLILLVLSVLVLRIVW